LRWHTYVAIVLGEVNPSFDYMLLVILKGDDRLMLHTTENINFCGANLAQEWK